MKKFMRSIALCMVLAMMLGITAFATEVTGAEGMSVEFEVSEDGEKLEWLEYYDSVIVAGGQYMVFVVDADYDLPTADSILYINQAEADEDGIICFENIYPKEMTNSKIMLSGTGITAPMTIAEIAVGPDPLLGDVDGNGAVDIGDATLLLKYLADSDTELDLDVADVDVSGSVDVGDATRILKDLAGLKS